MIVSLTASVQLASGILALISVLEINSTRGLSYSPKYTLTGSSIEKRSKVPRKMESMPPEIWYSLGLIYVKSWRSRNV